MFNLTLPVRFKYGLSSIAEVVAIYDARIATGLASVSGAISFTILPNSPSNIASLAGIIFIDFVRLEFLWGISIVSGIIGEYLVSLLDQRFLAEFSFSIIISSFSLSILH